MEETFERLHLTGVKVNYFFVCPRKLWLFDRGIQMEKESDRVFLGKLLDEESYPRKKRRQVTIGEVITIDIVNENTIQEVKYSRSFHRASVMQLGYYLYYLRKLGMEKEGVLSYPRQKRQERVVLTEGMVRELEEAIGKIVEVLARSSPPPVVEKSYCRKCAYFEFCFG
ncbi:MAG: CRISPR-associated protein Cas4 [Candidatus Caldatribacteriaceae bacterium]